MEKTKIPAKTKELAFQKQGEIYILTDLQDKKSFNLDPISFLVWVQIDGKTSVNTIVDIFSVSENRDIIKAAVDGVLERLEHAGLIKWA